MNHVSVSPTDKNGPTQGQRKTLTMVGIEPTTSTFGLDFNIFSSHGLLPSDLVAQSVAQSRFNSHPGQSFSLSLCGPISISRANAHMVHMGLKSSTSYYTLFS